MRGTCYWDLGSKGWVGPLRWVWVLGVVHRGGPQCCGSSFLRVVRGLPGLGFSRTSHRSLSSRYSGRRASMDYYVSPRISLIKPLGAGVFSLQGLLFSVLSKPATCTTNLYILPFHHWLPKSSLHCTTRLVTTIDSDPPATMTFLIDTMLSRCLCGRRLPWWLSRECGRFVMPLPKPRGG